MITNESGGYRYLPGSRFAAHGVAADAGMRIDRVIFERPQELSAGFGLVRTILEAEGRPLHALCGIELRMPRRLRFPAFRELNDRYLEQLDEWGVLVDGQSPFCRTNVAPRSSSLTGPAIGAFSFTYGAANGARDFLLSGAAEIPVDAPYPDGVVRRGDTSPAGMAEKARAVAEIIKQHMTSLELKWNASATVHVYSQYDVAFATMREALAQVGVVPQEGLIWHDADPPTDEIEIEIDVRQYSGERLVSVHA